MPAKRPQPIADTAPTSQPSRPDPLTVTDAIASATRSGATWSPGWMG